MTPRQLTPAELAERLADLGTVLQDPDAQVTLGAARAILRDLPAPGRVTVANAHRKPGAPSETAFGARIYVGRSGSWRPSFGEDFSALGNPYYLTGSETREQVIERYGAYLGRVRESRPRAPQIQALRDLRRRVLNGESLILVCFCAPQSCHADVIARILRGERD